MIQILKSMTIENINYMVSYILVISGVLYVSIYSLAYNNKKILNHVYSIKPIFTVEKNGVPQNVPYKEIREVIKEKVTFFIGMLCSAGGALMQCMLTIKKPDDNSLLFRLILLGIFILTAIIYVVVSIMSCIKTKNILKLLYNGKLKPDADKFYATYE